MCDKKLKIWICFLDIFIETFNFIEYVTEGWEEWSSLQRTRFSFFYIYIKDQRFICSIIDFNSIQKKSRYSFIPQSGYLMKC